MSAEFKSGARNAWCDCVRGYAILLVCLSHLFYVQPLHRFFGTSPTYFKGDTGVFIFYVLSGFLVTGILAREVEGQQRPGKRLRAMGHFFARRLFRLQPSYLVFLLVYAIFCRTQDGLSWWVLLPPVSNWFGGPYITWHIKTLHIEESYYISIGIFSGLFRKCLKPLLWGFLAAGPVGRLALVVATKCGSQLAPWLLSKYLPVEAFAIGGLMVLYLGRVRTIRLAKTIVTKPALSFTLAMLGLLLTGVLRDVRPFSWPLLFTWPLLYSVFSALIVLSGLEQATFIFSAEWLRKLGRASYTVYLFQQFALGPWSETYGRPFSWLAWGAACGTIVIVLPLWYMLVEKPLTAAGAQLFPRLSNAVGQPQQDPGPVDYDARETSPNCQPIPEFVDARRL